MPLSDRLIQSGPATAQRGGDLVEWAIRLLGDYTLRNILLGTAWIGIVSGSLGTIALLRRQSLLGDVISHATLPGVVLAFLLWQRRDMSLLMAGAASAGFAAALLIFVVDIQTRIKRDGAMGLALALFFGTGIFLLSLTQNLPTARKAGLDRFIFGQAAALVHSDVIALLWVGLLGLGLLLVFWKELKVVTFDPEFAVIMGLPVRGLELLITGLIVLTIVMGLQAVGVILMSAMLIAPAAAARQWTNRMSAMVGIAALLGAGSSMAGAIISTLGPRIPTGPVIVLCLSAAVTVSVLCGARRGLIWRWLQARRSQAQMRTGHALAALYALWKQHGGQAHGHSRQVIQLARPAQGNIRLALEQLRGQGLVRQRADKGWMLTPEGIRAAREAETKTARTRDDQPGT